MATNDAALQLSNAGIRLAMILSQALLASSFDFRN
jgi:hypothetical protein